MKKWIFFPGATFHVRILPDGPAKIETEQNPERDEQADPEQMSARQGIRRCHGMG